MSIEDQKTVNGVSIDGVGRLFWWYSTQPNEKGFSLRLAFDDNNEEIGYGCIFRNVDPVTREQDSQNGYLLGVERPFPEWLSQFVEDVQEWTKTEQAVVSYDRTTPKP